MKSLALKKCLDQYLVEVAKPAKIDTRRAGYACDHLIAFFGAERDVATMKRRDGRDYRAHRLDKGVTDSTIRRELVVLNAALRHAVNEERIDAMPILPLPPEGEPRERWFTEEEVLRILSEPMSDETRTAIYIALFTGARRTAILELRWSRVDFVNGFLDFRVPGARVTKKRRVKTKMAEPLRNVLLPRSAGAKPNDLVVGKTPDAVSVEVRKVLKRAGIDERGVGCHVFRRTFATWAFLNGAKPAEVRAATGDSMATLEKSYVKLFPEHSAGAVNSIHIPTQEK